MKNNRTLSLFVLLIASLVLAACAPAATSEPTAIAEPTATPEPIAEAPALTDIVDTAVANGSFTTLAAALEAAGLVETLKGAGPYTVFAPTDEAFAKLPAGTVEDLLKPENLETLKNVLLYHVVVGKLTAEDILKLDGEIDDTVYGQFIKVAVMDDRVTLNDNAQVIATDVEASNGLIHVIDSVLLPDVEQSDMSEPSDPAMQSDIVDTAVADGRFTTLVAALQAAGLVDILKQRDGLTVFAPTDEAFAKLPAGTIDDLLKPENLETLKNILLYHVVPEKLMAADVIKLDGQFVGTMPDGAPVNITVKDGKVYLNDTVEIIVTDIETSNGVIHVIDAVLLPQ